MDDNFGGVKDGGQMIRQQTPFAKYIFLLYLGRRAEVYPLVAMMNLLAVMEPRGVLAIHLPGEVIEA